MELNLWKQRLLENGESQKALPALGGEWGARARVTRLCHGRPEGNALGRECEVRLRAAGACSPGRAPLTPPVHPT